MSSDLLSLLHNAWKTISIPRSEQHEGKLPISSSSPTSVTRIRSLTVALPQNHDNSHRHFPYPPHAYAIEMEKLEYYPSVRRSGPLKIFFTLSYAAPFTMYQFMSGSQGQPWFLLVGASVVIAFVASFSAMHIANAYPRTAAIVEKIGSLLLALGFFLMAAVIFSESLIMLMVIAGLAALAILAFFIGCTTSKI